MGGVEIRLFEPLTGESPSFIRVALTKAAYDIRIVERHTEPGAFSLRIPTTNRVVNRIRKEQYIQIDRYFWGLVDDFRIVADGSGNALEISGPQLKALARDRISLPPDTPESELAGTQGYDVVNGTTETCMKHFAQANMTKGKRAVPGLVIAPDQGRGVEEDKYMTRHESLEDIFRELGDATGLGYDILPDLEGSTLVFDVVEGVNRSADQAEVPPVIFEQSRKSILSSEYQHKTTGSKNVFYTTMSGAKYADEALTMVYYREGEEDSQTARRREMHMTISADTPIAGEEYSELKRLALLKAEEYRPEESFACDVTESRYRYREHYFLGDWVTGQDRENGVSVKAQITEVETSYTETGITRRLTLGRAPLNVFGRLRRTMRRGE